MTDNNVLPKKKKINWMRTIFIISFIIVPTVNFLIFYVYVNFSSFAMAFSVAKDGQLVASLDNFKRFFEEFSNPVSDIRIAFKNTFLTFLISQIMFPLGVFVSYFIYKKIWMSGVFRYIFFMPGLIAATVLTSFWLKLIGNHGPIVEFIQTAMHLDYRPTLLTDQDYSNKMVLLYFIWLAFPGNLIMWGGAFSRLPVSVLESAKLDGVGWFRELIQIIIPMIWPTFAMLWMLACSGVFNASGPVFLMTKGDYGTMTLQCWLYMQVYGQTGGVGTLGVYNYLSAIGLILTVLAMIVTIVVRKIANSVDAGVEY